MSNSHKHVKHSLEKKSHFLCETSPRIFTCIFGNLEPSNYSCSLFLIPDALLTSVVLPSDFLGGTEVSWPQSWYQYQEKEETEGPRFMAHIAELLLRFALGLSPPCLNHFFT